MPSSVPVTATIDATRTKYQMPSPEARMAMISLSDASRLNPSSTPHSTAMGIVNLNRLGSVKRNTSATSTQRGTIPHHHLKNVWQLRHEQNEREKRAADEREGENFAENVAGEDAHKQSLRLV